MAFMATTSVSLRADACGVIILPVPHFGTLILCMARLSRFNRGCIMHAYGQARDARQWSVTKSLVAHGLSRLVGGHAMAIASPFKRIYVGSALGSGKAWLGPANGERGPPVKLEHLLKWGERQ